MAPRAAIRATVEASATAASHDRALGCSRLAGCLHDGRYDLSLPRRIAAHR
jgi:hypothetical protein